MATRKTAAAAAKEPPATDPADPADPASGDVDAAQLARREEAEQLWRERDVLLDRIQAVGGTAGDKVTLAVARAEVNALKEVAARLGADAAPKAMAQGTYDEIQRTGHATDPLTHRVLTRADLPDAR